MSVKANSYNSGSQLLTSDGEIFTYCCLYYRKLQITFMLSGHWVRKLRFDQINPFVIFLAEYDHTYCHAKLLNVILNLLILYVCSMLYSINRSSCLARHATWCSSQIEIAAQKRNLSKMPRFDPPEMLNFSWSNE